MEFPIIHIPIPSHSDSDRSRILEKLPHYIVDNDIILVQGDTATANYSCLVAFQMKKKIERTEAGLRTYDLLNPFPEEAYRQMISRMATFHFIPHVECEILLQKEQVSGQIIHVGNTILDSVRIENHKSCNRHISSQRKLE